MPLEALKEVLCCMYADQNYIYQTTYSRVMWVPVTTVWLVLGLRMGDTASRYGV